MDMSEKIYIASPFFNEFEVKVRDNMEKKVRETFPSFEIIRPDLSENSKGYAVADSSNRFKKAKAVYEDNIRDIESASILVFPRWTEDLGTNFEVGYAIACSVKTSYVPNKKIYRYDYLSDSLIEIDTSEIERIANSVLDLIRNKSIKFSDYVIKLKSPSHVVMFGILAGLEVNPVYEIEGGADNIMLAAKFRARITRIVSPEKRNWEEGIL